MIGCSADFLKSLPKFDPSKIAQVSPTQIAEAARQAAEAAAGKAAAAASSPQSVADFGKDAVQKGQEALDKTSPQQEISKALDAASGALQNAKDRVETASPTDVKDAVTRAGDAALPQGTTFEDLAHAASGASKQDVADTIRQATPQLTEAVSRTGQHISEGVRGAVPKATALVNRTGEHVVSALGGRPLGPAGGPSETMPEEPMDGEGTSSKLMGLFLLTVAAVAGYFVAQRFKQGSVRSPILLSDALDGVHGDSPQMRGGSMQLSSRDDSVAFARMTDTYARAA